MSKVRCKVCSYENNSRCDVKKVTVHPNKSRTCTGFDYDATKVRIKQKLSGTYIKGGDMKAHRKEMMEAHAQQASGAKVESANPDILSRFRSTAE